MERFRSQVTSFVLGFGCCAVIARLLLTTPAAATSPSTFRAPNAADVVNRVGNTVVNLDAFPDTPPDRSAILPQLFGQPEASPGDPTAVASGVIISRDGYIATNNHVVSDAGKLRARLADGREFDARMVGRDPHSDLAVVKIDGHDFTPARFADSRHARPGESVVAIGNPLGFENSVSVGVVSANRSGPIRVDGQTMGDMIQTDAAINQGNSGGGLFNAQGELIGINTAIMVPHGGTGSIGIGFAVPAHRVKPVTQALITEGRMPRPWLGIRYRLSSGGSLVRRMRNGIGVLVEGVVPGSPAARAGIRPADILRKLGNLTVRGGEDVYNFVDRFKPGQTIQAKLLRGGHEETISLSLAENKDPE